MEAEKEEGYALVWGENKDRGLVFEQYTDTDVHVHGTDNVAFSNLFGTIEHARTVAKDIKEGTGEWKYIIHPEVHPVAIVHVVKTTEYKIEEEL
jgi:hypothetical protein